MCDDCMNFCDEKPIYCLPHIMDVARTSLLGGQLGPIILLRGHSLKLIFQKIAVAYLISMDRLHSFPLFLWFTFHPLLKEHFN